MLTRRTLLQYTAAAFASAPFAALAQLATLSSVAYLSRRLDVSHADYRTWYVTHHAVDFMSFAKPYLSRYSQDFVEHAHMADVDFDVISEFGWRSAEARAAALKFMGTPEGKTVMALHPNPGSKPGPNEDHSGARTYSIEPRLVAGAPRRLDKPATKKQAALLRRKDNATPEAFAAAVDAYANTVFTKAKGKAERVMVNLAVPEPGRPAPFHDAIMMTWPKAGANLADAMKDAPAQIEVVNILDLIGYDSDVGAA